MENREFTKMIILESRTESLYTKLQAACARIRELESRCSCDCDNCCSCDCDNCCSCDCKPKSSNIDGARALMAGNDYYG